MTILSGIRAGDSIPIVGTSARIGRGPANDIVIPDVWLSDPHCSIHHDGTRFSLEDLDSLNGTYVNGERVTQCRLEHDDHIRFGATETVFLIAKDDAATDAIDPSATLRLNPGDAAYLRPGGLDPERARTPRTWQDLDALLRISNALKSIQDSETLQRQLLEMVLDATVAEHAAVWLAHPGNGTLGRELTSAGTGEQRVDRAVAERVFRDGVVVMSNQTGEGDGRQTATPDGSFLCVPLKTFRSNLGVLYLSRLDSDAAFSRDDFDLVTAVASIAAMALENVRHVEGIEADRSRLIEEVDARHRMVGDGPEMRRVSELIGKAAPTPSTVLIEGESGTGKELVARAIHRNSPRAEAPFIAINCAVLPSELVESELFGHEKGAFTGAVSRKKGRFETADRGTLFLDEIGELPLQLQAKLLRAVQSGSFDRVGGLEPVEVDVRILAATNRNLREAVAEGQFREDLYFRLNVIAIRMPALRERPEDIPALAAHFASTVGAKLGRRLTISEPALDVLKRYDWPGNVRELENAIERAAVLGNGDVILPEDLPEPVLEAQAPGSEGDATNYQDAVNAFKRRHILDVIQKTRDMSEAAGLLGVHPNNLNRLIRRLNLRQELAARSGGRTG